MNQLIYLIICFIVGILIFLLIRSYCGCNKSKVVEGTSDDISNDLLKAASISGKSSLAQSGLAAMTGDTAGIGAVAEAEACKAIDNITPVEECICSFGGAGINIAGCIAYLGAGAETALDTAAGAELGPLEWLGGGLLEGYDIEEMTNACDCEVTSIPPMIATCGKLVLDEIHPGINQPEECNASCSAWIEENIQNASGSEDSNNRKKMYNEYKQIKDWEMEEDAASCDNITVCLGQTGGSEEPDYSCSSLSDDCYNYYGDCIPGATTGCFQCIDNPNYDWWDITTSRCIKGRQCTTDQTSVPFGVTFEQVNNARFILASASNTLLLAQTDANLQNPSNVLKEPDPTRENILDQARTNYNDALELYTKTNDRYNAWKNLSADDGVNPWKMGCGSLATPTYFHLTTAKTLGAVCGSDDDYCNVIRESNENFTLNASNIKNSVDQLRTLIKDNYKQKYDRIFGLVNELYPTPTPTPTPTSTNTPTTTPTTTPTPAPTPPPP